MYSIKSVFISSLNTCSNLVLLHWPEIGLCVNVMYSWMLQYYVMYIILYFIILLRENSCIIKNLHQKLERKDEKLPGMFYSALRCLNIELS